AQLTGHAPMWAVTLLDGVNDSDDDARALANRALAFATATGKRPRLSIIAYNSIGDSPMAVRDSAVRDSAVRDSAVRDSAVRDSAVRDSAAAPDPFRRSSRERAFRDILASAGLPSHRRYSGGSDVAAACGQLAARVP